MLLAMERAKHERVLYWTNFSEDTIYWFAWIAINTVAEHDIYTGLGIEIQNVSKNGIDFKVKDKMFPPGEGLLDEFLANFGNDLTAMERSLMLAGLGVVPVQSNSESP
jgi:hypothetical protein